MNIITKMVDVILKISSSQITQSLRELKIILKKYYIGRCTHIKSVISVIASKQARCLYFKLHHQNICT